MSASLVLTLNAGSSSVKFALFQPEAGTPRQLASGQVEAIGGAARFRAKRADGSVAAEEQHETGAALGDHDQALARILDWIEGEMPGARVGAVGHRIVHGGPRHAAPAIIDATLVADLARLEPLAPLHQPHNLAGVRAAIAAFPDAVQVACFDTAFHRAQSDLRQAYAIPRRLFDAGVRRYGFHGLSYEFIAAQLKATRPEAHAGRVIVAHLGNGASMAAMVEGRSVASTMGFTALDGLVMGTRCGSIDPGVVLYLMEVEKMDADAISDLLYQQSGLKGLSGISNDVRVLETSPEPAAAFALDVFVDRAVRAVGELAAALDGLDTLVFTAGIGENSASMRRRICARLRWMGLALDEAANEAGAPVVSAPDSQVEVLVMRTNEEAMIARHALRLAGGATRDAHRD